MSKTHPQQQAIAASLNQARQSKADGGPSDKIFCGPIIAEVAGRTDHLPTNVASGAYVIPADIISAMGEGNTMAGMRIANDIFGMQEKRPDDVAVEVVLAGGEYVITPFNVTRIGGGDIDRGHETLDEFIKKYRAQTIQTLKKLPGPKRD